MAKDGSPAPDMTDDDDADTPRTWKDAWPFLVALGIVVVLAAGIGISYLVRPADERMSDSALVQHAINNAYTARNEVDYAKYRDSVCVADTKASTFPTEEQFVEENRTSMDSNGPIEIPEITDLTVSGDRASAQVHWHFEKSEDKTQVTDTVVVREDGDWKVCTS